MLSAKKNVFLFNQKYPSMYPLGTAIGIWLMHILNSFFYSLGKGFNMKAQSRCIQASTAHREHDIDKQITAQLQNAATLSLCSR
jgi:hypothetical protein